jgi:spermidine synthase
MAPGPLLREIFGLLFYGAFVLRTSSAAVTASETSEQSISSKRILEEEFEIGYAQSLTVDYPPITSIKSDYQNIAVYTSKHYGMVLTIDDNLQLTERDASHYNEMLAHVPVMEYLSGRSDHTEPIRVMLVGGGDGYVVAELLKHPQVRWIDHVELDEEVINVSKENLPWADAWNDERVNLVITDGAKFVKDQAERGINYHVIVQDSSDPFWYEETGAITISPSSVLFELSYFKALYSLVRFNEGVLMFQSETYNLPSNLEAIRNWRGQLQDVGFCRVRYGSISIGTYSTGQIGFLVAHAGHDKENKMASGSGDVCGDDSCNDPRYSMDVLPELEWNKILTLYNEINGKTLYYHPRIHRSSYDLPLWVEEFIYGSDISTAQKH